MQETAREKISQVTNALPASNAVDSVGGVTVFDNQTQNNILSLSNCTKKGAPTSEQGVSEASLGQLLRLKRYLKFCLFANHRNELQSATPREEQKLSCINMHLHFAEMMIRTAFRKRNFFGF